MSNQPISHSCVVRRSVLGLASIVGVGLAAGCASFPGNRSGHIEIDEARGFSVVETIEATPEITAQFDEALRELRAGRNDAGIEILDRVAEAAPEIAVVHINLGIARARNGDLEGAARDLRDAISINPKHPVAHNELGIVYRKMGKFAKARDSYENALDVYPDFHFARRNLAILCDVYLSDARCAVKNYELYTQLVPEDEAVSMWLADLRNRMGE